MKIVGYAGEPIFKTLRGVVDWYAEVNSSDFNVSNYPAAVVAIEVVQSHKIIVVNSIGGDAACELAEQAFLFQKEKTIILGNVGGIRLLCNSTGNT